MKFLSFFFLLFICLLLPAQQLDTETESPYLKVLTEDAQVPLKATRIHANIAGTIAHVQVSQVYQNTGNTPIEAQFVFPLSTQAAIHKMDMKVGDRTLHAQVFEKEQAQKVYDQAVREGKRAAKLDQERPNVFKMNVGNLMPGDEITLDVYYTELLIPENGSYQFMFPGVVGPRYTGENATGESTFHLPYTEKGVAATFDYDMKVELSAGMIIQHISSPSHDIVTRYPNSQTADISIAPESPNPSNRDFILNYQLRGKEIQSGLLLYAHGDEKFFAYQMEPLQQVKIEDIPPREYVFIVDVSGSMNGYPLDVSKELLKNLLCNLRETDEFNVMLFASSSQTFRPQSVAVTPENLEAALNFLSHSRGGGGTQLLSALETAYALPRSHPSVARSMVVITDGYVSVERAAFELIRHNLDQANVFTFGIGSSVNRYLIEGMAKISQSESFIATRKEEAHKVANLFADYISTPLLTQVSLEAQGFEVYDVAQPSIPDVLASRPVVIHGKWRGDCQGKLIIKGYHGSEKFVHKYEVKQGVLSEKNEALRYLWARKKIELLDDYRSLFNAQVQEEVTELGLTYNLLTQYTSFVAVDEEVVNREGALTKVAQPLPMPQHVNNSAIGAEAEVKSTASSTQSFYIEIVGTEKVIEKSEERRLKIWFRSTFSDLIKPFLKPGVVFEINIDASGKLRLVEKGDDCCWQVDTALTPVLRQHWPDELSVSGPVMIAVTR